MPAVGLRLARVPEVCEADAMSLRVALLSLAVLLSPALARADVAPRCRCDAPGRSSGAGRAGMVLPLALAALVPLALRRRRG